MPLTPIMKILAEALRASPDRSAPSPVARPVSWLVSRRLVAEKLGWPVLDPLPISVSRKAQKPEVWIPA